MTLWNFWHFNPPPHGNLMIYGEVMDIFWKDTFHLYVMVHLFACFKFYFPLFQTHYHTSPYSKTKEKKIQTKDKIIEPQRTQS